MGRALTLPTPGDAGTNGVWGTTLNTAFSQMNDDFLAVRKTADEAINSTTLQNDDHLLLPVAVSAVYLVEWWLRIDGPAANDFKYSWTGPASATMVWASLGINTGDATNLPPTHQDAPTLATVINHGCAGAGTFTQVRGQGYFVNSTTAGSLQMQWAQVAAAASTTVRIGSWLKAQRVA